MSVINSLEEKMQTNNRTKRCILHLSTALMLLWSMMNYAYQQKLNDNSLSPFSNSQINGIGINPECIYSYQMIVMPLKILLNLSH